MKLLRCFCVGRKFRAFRVFGSKRVAILKNAVLSLCFIVLVMVLFKLALGVSD